MAKEATTFDMQFGKDYIRFRDAEPYTINLHCHNDLQITIALEYSSFEVCWIAEDGGREQKLLSAGGICLVPPMLEHEMAWINRAHFVNLHIHPDSIATLVGHLYDLDAITLNEQIGIKDSFLQNIGHGISQMSRLHGDKLDHYYRSALALAVHHVYANYASTPTPQVAFDDIDRLPSPKIRQAINYMFANCHRVVPIEELAETVQMSTFHFMRIFKKSTGMSPARFHLMHRLESAKKLLGETSKSLAEIAEMLGFSSQSHFSALFMKNIGTTPIKFRRQMMGTSSRK